jgi:glyoxylase-like metal-dependent hydrolase (beta-lactamase superfamily II)
MRPINNYVRVIDLTAPASRATGATNNILGGGGSTNFGPGNFSQQIAAAQVDVNGNWTANAIEFYLTPWGFLKGAAENNASASKEKGMTVLSWSPKATAVSGKNYVLKGYVNNKNLVDRVETWFADNIMGDMQILQTYTGWKDFGGGAMAPAKIVQTRGGFPFFEVTVTAARANPTDLASLALPPAPAAGKGGPGGPGGAAKGPGGPPPLAPGGAAKGPGGPPGGAAAKGPGGPGGPGAAKGAPAPLVVTEEKLGDGLYRLTTGGGSYDSLIVEFKDYVMMLEAGDSIRRGEAYIAKTKQLIPNKPIRYVMNTHPHSDHTGGLPALVAEGATIIAYKTSKDFLEKSLSNPRTLLDDVLSKNPKPAKVEAIGEKKVYTDGTRTVEMYNIVGAPHSNALLVAYFPKEKILFQGDFSIDANPANDHVWAMVPVLEKLKLDYNRYINVHAPANPQTKADVMAAYKRRQDAK